MGTFLAWPALPPELQLLVALALPDKEDVLHLSCTSRGTHALLNGPAPLTAWLWRRHGNDAIFEVVTARSPAVLRQLIEVHHADVGYARKQTDGVSRTLLQHACYVDWADTVRELLRDPAFPVNETTRLGSTGLHIAAFYNRTDAVRALLRHPAVLVNATRFDGQTSLHCAASRRSSVTQGSMPTYLMRRVLRLE